MITPDRPTVEWKFHTFATLDTSTLFQCLKMRVDVFVVEQACAYPELDDHDTAPDTVHLLGYINEQLAAYARAMPTNESHMTTKAPSTSAVRIGRVVVLPTHRGTGVAQELMQTLIEHLVKAYPERHQILAAQDGVAFFYENLGFKRVSDVYLEDNIPHVDMLRMT